MSTLSSNIKKQPKSKKRPLQASEISADRVSLDNYQCGVCHEPIHNSAAHYEDSELNGSPGRRGLLGNNGSNNNVASTTPNIVNSSLVSCVNVETFSCKSSSSEGASPHFHFACLDVPKKSKASWDIRQYTSFKEQRRKDEEQSNGKGKTKNGVHHKQFDKDKDKGPFNAPSVPSTANLEDGRSKVISPLHSDIGDVDMNGGNNNKEPIINPFLCPLCDVLGTSKYLLEYFQNFRALKSAFFGDDECVENLQPVGCIETEKTSCNSLTPIEDYRGVANEHGFVKHLMLKQSEAELPHKETELTMGRIIDIYNGVSHGDGGMKANFDIENINATYLIGQPIRLFCNITDSYHTGRIIDSRIMGPSDLARLNPGTMRRMNQGNNSEGGGKRLESNSNSTRGLSSTGEEASHGIKLDRDIGRTLYLVRFRSNIEGRKIALQQWIYLEEHPVMVGVAIVWAKINQETGPQKSNEGKATSKQSSTTPDKKRSFVERKRDSPDKKRHIMKSRSKFRPAQFFVRTALEMMHVDELNCKKTTNGSKSIDAIVFFFSYKHRYARISLKISPSSKAFSSSSTRSTASIDKASLEAASPESILTHSFEDLDVADFHDPPQKLAQYLQLLKAYDNTIAYSTASACMEEEEQRRIIEGQNRL